MDRNSPTIVIIDQNRVGRKVYSRIMARHFGDKARILEVDQGADALYFCQSQEISLILIDDDASDMTYMTFLGKIQTLPEGKRVPVVVITSEGDETRAVEAIKAGARDYLIKGKFSQDTLGPSMERAMAEVHLLREIKHEKKERARIETNLRLFRDLINQTVDALFIVDPFSGVLLDFNDSAWRNLGYDAGELRQITMREVLDGFGKPSAWNNLLARIREEGNWTYEGLFIRKDTSTYPVEVTLHHVKRGDEEYLVGVARDITRRKEIEEKLRDLSNRDGLTGLYNRRYLDETLEREWNRRRREGKPLHLIMLDVDHFKKYNDTYGHLAGDECLKSVSKLMQEHFRRASEFSARYGGEEFAVVLMESNKDDVLQMAEQFRKDLEAKAMPHKSNDAADVVTVSLGVAGIQPSQHGNPKDLIERADRALYKAKGAGRNRVEQADG